MDDEFQVNGLPLPVLLISLLQEGKWRHPGDAVMRKVVPFIDVPLSFLSVPHMRTEGELGRFVVKPGWAKLMHVMRGTLFTSVPELPWLDADKAFGIIINHEIGDDVAIALDYRTDMNDPRVVASEWRDRAHFWREVTPTFTEFIRDLGLLS
jgi:hypothetical protein